MQNKSLSLTENSLFKGILFFSIPLMFSNILQSLFNMADIAVVGQFAGSIALGAVGSTSQLVFLFTGFLEGLANGIIVITAFYLGAKNRKETTETIKTALIICMFTGIFLCVAGVSTSGLVLKAMNTKAELLPDATLYLKIYMLGFPALAIYNFGNAVYSASGNTKKTLYFLAISGVLNVILNLFFVLVLKMDVDGVALASIISQYICAFCIITSLRKESSEIHLSFDRFKTNTAKMARILKVGLPSGLQNMIFAFANIFIQMGVNSFSATAVAGNSTAANADPFIYGIMSAFYVASSTYIGQNYGAKKKDRILKSYFISTGYAFFIALGLGLLLLIFATPFLKLFTNDAEVLDFGLQRLSIMSVSYCVSAFMDGSIAASRGLGKTGVPSVIVILGSCVFRIVWIYTIFAYFKTIPSLYLLYVFSWGITALLEIIYFVKVYKQICRW